MTDDYISEMPKPPVYQSAMRAWWGLWLIARDVRHGPHPRNQRDET
jgi:hypothetical protein